MFRAAKTKAPSVYMLAGKRDGVLYIGVTSDLPKRLFEHSQELIPGFTSRYKVKHLVYYEVFENMEAAIVREKRLKDWHRAWKVRLIHGFNPEWRDLFDAETGEIADGPADVERERG